MTLRRVPQNVTRLCPSISCQSTLRLHPDRVFASTLATSSKTSRKSKTPDVSSTVSRKPKTSDASNAPAKSSKPAPSASDTAVKKLWDEIHKLEGFLKIPHSSTDGRWREVRLRGKAQDLVAQKVQKLLRKHKSSESAVGTIGQELTPFERELYNGPETKSTDQKDFEATLLALQETEAEKKAREMAEWKAANGKKMAQQMAPGKPKKRATHTLDLGGKRPKKLPLPPSPAMAAKKGEEWKAQKFALHNKLKGERWDPKKRLSPDTVEGIKYLNQSDPEQYTTPVLAKHFGVSAEAIRRIIKSKWQPNEEESDERRERWERRGERIWTDLAAEGVRPPKKWRVMGVGKAPPGKRPLWDRTRQRQRERFRERRRERRKLGKREAIPWDTQSLGAMDEHVGAPSMQSASSQVML